MPTTFHVAWSVDVDRFSDAYLKRRVLPGMIIDGRQPTVAELRQMCAEARQRGQAVFRPCDSTKPDGSCAGHPDHPPAPPPAVGSEVGTIEQKTPVAASEGEDGDG